MQNKVNLRELNEHIKSGNSTLNMELIGKIRLGDVLLADDDFNSDFAPVGALANTNLLVTEDTDY